MNKYEKEVEEIFSCDGEEQLQLTKGNLLFIDAQTRRKGMIRLTAFAKTIEELARYYQDWVKEHHLLQKDIWFANIFECGTNRHLGFATIDNSEGEIRIEVVAKPKYDPFHRSLGQYLDLLLNTQR